MGRPKKTPVKERKLCVYVPTNEVGEQWKRYAKKNGMSLSGFITEVVENRILEEGTVDSHKAVDKQLNELQEQNKRLQTGNVDLSKKVDMLNSLTDRLQEDLQRLQNERFKELNGFDGARQIEMKLVDLFKEHKNLKDTQILDMLHIKPDDTATNKALSKQLDVLFAYGLIKKLRGGYQWLG